MTEQLKPDLQIGEMVYKIIGPIDILRATKIFRGYDNILTPDYIAEKMLGLNLDFVATAKHRVTGRYYRISSVLLGYVGSSRVGGGQEGVIENPVLYGYNVLWQRKSGGEYNNFEDETTLLPLRDIIIIDPVTLRRELLTLEKGQ